MYEQRIVDAVLNEVRKGTTYAQISLKYHVPISTISEWGKKYNVKSIRSFKKDVTKEEVILSILKEKKVLTIRELANILNVSFSSVNKKLNKMVAKGSVKSVLLIGGGNDYPFRKFLNKKLYFISDEDFVGWAKDKVRGFPVLLKTCFLKKLREIGYELNEKKKSRYLYITEGKVCEKIINLAEKRGMNPSTLATQMLSTLLENI